MAAIALSVGLSMQGCYGGPPPRRPDDASLRQPAPLTSETTTKETR